MSVSRDHRSLDYYDHLEILRWKILRVAVAVLVAGVLCFIWIEPLVLLLKRFADPSAVSLVYLRPQEKFLSYMKIALFSGIALAVPYAVAELSAFIYPALNKPERRTFLAACAAVPVLFFAGLLFSYFVVVPAALKFFLNFAAGDAVRPFWSIGEYFDFVLSAMAALGIVFLLPPALLVLIRVRILTVRILDRFRPYIILGIAVIAAALSPPDIVSQLLVGVPLYLLFELTVLIGRLLSRR